MENIENSQIGLFEDEQNISNDKITVVKSKFLGYEDTYSKELFDGFDTIRAITFSSGINFMGNVLSGFSDAEVIFGCRDIVSRGVAAAISVQSAEIEEIARDKNAKYFAERIENGTLKFYVSKETKSHEKLYILSSQDGKTRIITGSANFSANAFTGRQRESIMIFDNDDSAYKYYLSVYEEYRDECGCDVSHKLINGCLNDTDYLKDNIGEIPIIKKVEKEEIVYLDSDNNSDDFEFVRNVKEFENEIKDLLPKYKTDQGKILLTNNEEFKNFKKKHKTAAEIKKIKNKKLVKLNINYETGMLTFAGKQLDMHPDKEKIASDLQRIMAFMDSLKSFSGNVEEGRSEFFKYLNWYFLSLFNPYLRTVAYNSGYDVYLFPVYGIMYGDSNGGKTTFNELLSKLMCGKKIDPSGSDDFTSTTLQSIKLASEGLPINIEDLAKSQYANNFEKIIKDDFWGITQGNVNYPATSISTNKIPSLASDISKRVIACHINIAIGKTEGARLKKKVSDNIKGCTNALYCEYVSRMYPLVIEMGEKMKQEGNDYFPDIFEASSKTISELFEEYLDCPVPSYVKQLNHSSYFGDEAIGYNAKRKILSAWQSEPTAFKIDKSRNKLIYSYPENGNQYQLKYFKDELPPRLGCEVAGRTLTMNYEEAVKFFEIKFKKGIFGKMN